MPIFDALRPEGPREEGFAHAGPVGAGHFSKMVHNGIEYGLMQAYAEGFELLQRGRTDHTTCPAVLQAWSRGTVVRSWLLDLLVHRAQGRPGAGRARRLRRRLRRGPLDHRGGDHARGAAAGDLRGAVRPVRLPAGVLAGHARGGGAAPAVRRARGEVARPARPARRASTPGRARARWRATQACMQRMHLRRLAVADFRSWERGRARPGAGGHRAGRPERGGQDQPGRGGRLPGHPRLAPGGHRRAADPARRRAGGGPRAGRAPRPRAERRAGDHRGQGQPGPGEPGAGGPAARRAGHPAHGAVRARGPGPGPRRPGRAPPLPGRPAGRPRFPATRRCARTTSGCCGSARRC